MAIDPVFASYCSSKGLTAFEPGAVADRNPIVGPVAAHFEVWAQRFVEYFPNIPKLCVGLIERTSLGAAADLWGDIAIIYVHASAPTIFANLAGAILSHPNSLQVEHAADIERHPGGFCVGEDRLLERLFNNGCLIDFPPGIAQRSLPVGMAICNFMLFHEMVHIRNGHVDLFKKNCIGPLAMEETMMPELSSMLSALDLQTMEWDADRNAYKLSADAGMTLILGRRFTECSSEDIRFAFWVFHIGIYVLFKLMELAEPPNIKARVHPTPIVRMILLMADIEHVAKLLKVEGLPDTFDAQVTVSGEVVWALITGTDFVPLDEQLIEIHMQTLHATRIMHHWNLLRERLAPFNRGTQDLAPPMRI